MATESTRASSAAPQVVVVDAQAHAAQRIAQETQELNERLAAEGRKFNETVPGGKFLGPDGKTFHDAHGNPVSESAGAKAKAKSGEIDLSDPAAIAEELRAIEERRAMLVERASVARAQQIEAQQAGERPIEPANTIGLKAGAMPGGDEDDEEEGSTKRRRSSKK